ncbi:right-handed parallel beta-helix repeat-containing protein [Zobellia uliginosa]|uniref:right-handed parallel beta-helix repeat-containing protein n=1 Tax=Zobellia uliginosa TaxID=143224 RepID=UPI001C06DED4|nr:right-handed parallel beta-helix repeat-containing protein [Zobellia uliginosa]MBU2947800.1 right-handed parallel beta-helix repeat-containing protein [Zobellia uliginosa]
MDYFKSFKALYLCAIFCFGAQFLSAQQTIHFKPEAEDMTPLVREALKNSTDKNLTLVFEKGTYKFLPDYATQRYSFITNHGNGLKNIIFLLENFDSVTIEGNGSVFIFHGQVAPFQIRNCNQLTVKNLKMDWDIPFLFQGEVLAVDKNEGWRDVKPFTDGFSWELKKDRIFFPNVDGFSFPELGSTLAFNAEHKRVAHGAWDMGSRPRWVEERPDGVLRFHEHLKQYPPVGSILNSKGDHDHNRYAPAFQITSSKNIHLEDITIHHALGMGFLFERTDNITIHNCGIYVRKGSDRVVSTIADATHFANCKGDILIEDSTFKHMLDDGTNVHGTYVVVNKVLDERTVRVALQHFEQMGFEFAASGDEVWFIQQPSPKRASENVVDHVSIVNDKYSDITFKNELPDNLARGDILENKTWNPTFTMRGCSIKDHRARNIVLKTPLKTIIENNEFSSMMSSIFFRGETYFWFESGAVEDVLIQNNNFEYCAYSGMEHAILNITPRLGKDFDQTEIYDGNIRFINNNIKTFDNRIVWADRVDGLTISGNVIEQTTTASSLHPDGYQFDFKNCINVEVSNNTYKGNADKVLKLEGISTEKVKYKRNKGFAKIKKQ